MEAELSREATAPCALRTDDARPPDRRARAGSPRSRRRPAGSRRRHPRPRRPLPAPAGRRRPDRGRKRAARHELRVRDERRAPACGAAGAAGVPRAREDARPLRPRRARAQQVDSRRVAGGLPARHAVRAVRLAWPSRHPDRRGLRKPMFAVLWVATFACVLGARAFMRWLGTAHRSDRALPRARAQPRRRARIEAKLSMLGRHGGAEIVAREDLEDEHGNVLVSGQLGDLVGRTGAERLILVPTRHGVRRRARPDPRGQVAGREDHALAALLGGARVLGRDRRAARHLAARDAPARTVAVVAGAQARLRHLTLVVAGAGWWSRR